MIRCAITNGTAGENEGVWLARVTRCLEHGVELLQIRERDLSARRLAELTRRVLALPNPHRTRILINDRADVALACGAHGVHLRDGSVLPEQFARPGFMVTIACHSLAGLDRTTGADFVILAPIFAPRSKTDERPPLGLEVLREAARISKIPVIALGGVTAENASACMTAGAVGIAGISYFNSQFVTEPRP